MNSQHKKIHAFFLAWVLTVSLMPVQHVTADDEPEETAICCITDRGNNLNAHNYENWHNNNINWASQSHSTLLKLDDGWMRVQGRTSELECTALIEYYNASFELTERKYIPLEMPQFGAFYAASDGYYYLITGNALTDKASVSTDKYDIAKYSTDWEQIAHVRTAGNDVTYAFDAGSVRCADDGAHLLIHTSREMSSSHQSNYTLEVDMQNMKITDQSTVKWLESGYVSHSFNQFLLLDGTSLVTLDHGDMYPRSVVLHKYSSDYTTGSFRADRGPLDIVDMVQFADLGDVNQADMFIINYTGVSVGGFAQSSTHYLTVYNSIDQTKWYNLVTKGDYWHNEPVRNVMVASVPKDGLQNENVKTITLTDYTEEDGSGGNPYLVQISEDRFLMMWQHNAEICYVFLDGTGEVTSEQYTMNGTLSDCEPVISGNQVYWYTWNNSDIRFYSIDLEDPSHTETVSRVAGHEYELTAEPDEDGYIHDICTKCGHSVRHVVPTDYTTYIYRREWDADHYWAWLVPLNENKDTMDAGDFFTYRILYCSPKDYDPDQDQFYSEIIEGSEYLQLQEEQGRYPYSQNYIVQDFDEDKASFTIKVWPRTNPALSDEITVKLEHNYKVAEVSDADGTITLECTGCGHRKQYHANTISGMNGETAEAVLAKDTFEYNHQKHKPAVTLTLTDPETAEVTELKQGTDFTVTYADNVNAGTGYAVIAPVPDSTKLSGTIVKPFTITPQNLDECTCTFAPSTLDVEDPETILYDAAKPTLTFRDKQGYLISEDDYYVKGMYVSTPDCMRYDYIDFAIHAQAQNYTNGTELYYPFPLIDLSNYQAEFKNAELAATGKITYSGYEYNPLVKVSTSKGRVLEPDTDYIVTYADNKEIGTATVTIEGINYYKGSITLNFDIVPKNQPAPPSNANGDLNGDGGLTKEDTVVLSNWLSGDTDAAPANWQAADYNHDRKLNAVDLSMMLRALSE